MSFWLLVNPSPYLKSIIDEKNIFVYDFRFNPKQLQIPNGYLSLCNPQDIFNNWEKLLLYLYIDMLSIKANYQICLIKFNYLEKYYQTQEEKFIKMSNELNLYL